MCFVVKLHILSSISFSPLPLPTVIKKITCFTTSNILESRKLNNCHDLKFICHKMRRNAERLSSACHTGHVIKCLLLPSHRPPGGSTCAVGGGGRISLPIRPAPYWSPNKPRQQPGCPQTGSSQPLSLRDTLKLSSVVYTLLSSTANSLDPSFKNAVAPSNMMQFLMQSVK